MRPRLSAALAAVLVAALCAAAVAAPPALRWTADAARPAPAEWVLLRGETRLLEPTLQEGRIPLAWPSNTVATLYWQTNGMASSWWSAPASLGTSTGQLSAVWSATNDVGAASYAYFVGAETPDGRTYSAHGTIRYRHGPGPEPNALPLPARTLDFATLVVTNPPWATPEAVAAVDGAVDELGGEFRATAAGLSNLVQSTTLMEIAARDDRADSIRLDRTTTTTNAPSGGTVSWQDAVAATIYGAPTTLAWWEPLGGWWVDTGEISMPPEMAIVVCRGSNLLWFAESSGMFYGAGLPESPDIDPGRWYSWDMAWEAFYYVNVVADLGSGAIPEWPAGMTYSEPVATTTNVLFSPVVAEADLPGHLAGHLPLSGGTLTGALTLAPAGATLQAIGIASNFTIRAVWNGTNISFNVYGEARQ